MLSDLSDYKVAGYGKEKAEFWISENLEKTGGQPHIGFIAANKEQIHAFYHMAIAEGLLITAHLAHDLNMVRRTMQHSYLLLMDIILKHIINVVPIPTSDKIILSEITRSSHLNSKKHRRGSRSYTL